MPTAFFASGGTLAYETCTAICWKPFNSANMIKIKIVSWRMVLETAQRSTWPRGGTRLSTQDSERRQSCLFTEYRHFPAPRLLISSLTTGSLWFWAKQGIKTSNNWVFSAYPGVCIRPMMADCRKRASHVVFISVSCVHMRRLVELINTGVLVSSSGSKKNHKTKFKFKCTSLFWTGMDSSH